MKILVINGPNINMLGIRETDVYGKGSYADLCAYIAKTAEDVGVRCKVFQSNSEGEIITEIQKAYNVFDGIVINAAGYTHTSVAILDALKAVSLPVVEVHITDIQKRENFRNFSYIALYAEKTIIGKGIKGYGEALLYLKRNYDI